MNVDKFLKNCIHCLETKLRVYRKLIKIFGGVYENRAVRRRYNLRRNYLSANKDI